MIGVRSFILNRRILITGMSLSVMVCLPSVLSHEVHSQESIAVRQQQVIEAFERVPYRIGDWQGEKLPVPEAAIEILRPSAILSRSFTNVEDGRQASLFVAHCSDARDMGGHYPPNCYPARGWTRDRSTEQRCRIVAGSTNLPVYAYHFRGGGKLDLPEQLRVFNFFLQSDGLVTADRPVINYLRERHSRSALGIVQVQVVMSGQMTLDDATDAASTLLDGVIPLLTTLAEGKIHDHANPG